MRDDIPTNRLLRVGIEHGARPTIDLRNHLIGNDDRDAKLIRQTLQRAHELGQMRLARRELPATDEVGAIERRRGVDDQQGKARLAHHGRGLVQQLQLVVGVVGAGVGDVVEDLFAGEAVAVGDGEEAHGAKGALGVDVQTLALAAAHVEGQLTGHGQRVADLALARPELAEDLRDAARLHPAGEQRVELLRARRDGDQLAASLVHFRRGGEAHRDEFGGWIMMAPVSGLFPRAGGFSACMPSASIFVAFCSEIPLICSSVRLGLFVVLVLVLRCVMR